MKIFSLLLFLIIHNSTIAQIPDWILYKPGSTTEFFNQSNCNGSGIWFGDEFNGCHGDFKFVEKYIGTPSNSINCIVVDKTNNYWYGTNDGLIKYDGTKFVIYTSLNSPLESNIIRKLVVDSSNNIWISARPKLYKFDGTNWSEFNFYDLNGGNQLAIDSLGNIWSCYSKGVVKYDGITTTYFDNTNSPFATSNNFTGMEVDGNNNIWVARPNAVYKYDGNSWILYDASNSVLKLSSYPIGVDTSGNVWISNGYNGLARYNGTSFDIFDSLNSNLPNVIPTDMVTDTAGTIWFTFRPKLTLPIGGGLFKYQDTTFTIIQNNDPLFSGEKYEIITAGSKGELLFNIYNDGLVIKSDSTWNIINTFHSELPSDYINFIKETGKDTLYVATGNGLSVKTGNNWKTFTSKNSPYFGDTDVIRDITEDLQHNVWIATSANGIIKIDPAGNWIKYDTSNSPLGKICYKILADSIGNIWIRSSDGFFKFDGNSFFQYNSANTPLQYNPYMNELKLGSNGKMFISTQLKGLLIFDYVNDTFAEYIPSNSGNPSYEVLSTEEDILGNIWIGGKNGLAKFDGINWTVYKSTNAPIHNNIRSLEFDSKGRLYILSGGGSNFPLKLTIYDNGNWLEYTSDKTPIGLSGSSASHIEIDNVDNAWIGTTGGLLLLNKYAGTDFKITGQIFLDENLNKVRDSIETGFPKAKVLLLPDSLETYTDGSGNFNFNISSFGNYEVKYLPTSNWQITTDSLFYSIFIDTSGSSNINIEFGTKAINDTIAGEVMITSSRLRCGDTTTIWLDYWNRSTKTVDGSVSFKNDSAVVLISSSIPPDVIVGDSMNWNFTNLHPNHQKQIRLTTAMPVPVQFPNDKIKLRSTVSIIDPINSNMFTGIDSIDSQLFCSYDPNDKQVNYMNHNGKNYIKNGSDLIYNIRFQNTGNDTAYNVFIIDTLANEIDWSTFEYLTASHPVQVFKKENVLRFNFDNIYLPDSIVNEKLSHGFIKFRVSLNPNLIHKTEIRNTAHIYFDYNPAIITNTITNTIVVCDSIASFEISPQDICEGDTIQLNYTGFGGEYFNWLVNNQLVDSASLSSVPLVSSGTNNLKLIVSNVVCLDSASNSINVDPAPPVPIISQSFDTLFSSESLNIIWYFNGSIIPGENKPFILVSQYGNYQVSTTDMDGCSSKSSPYFYTSTGILQKESVSILEISPNPFYGTFEVKISEEDKIIKITIFDINGKEVFNKKINNEFKYHHQSTLPEGFYIVKVDTEKGSYISKLISK